MVVAKSVNSSLEIKGQLFAQWVGMELLRLNRADLGNRKLYFWRDRNGIEVDWVLEHDSRLIPIEVKWTSNPISADIKHLQIFLKEYAKLSDKAYLVCQVPRPIQLSENIEALPWQELTYLLQE